MTSHTHLQHAVLQLAARAAQRYEQSVEQLDSGVSLLVDDLADRLGLQVDIQQTESRLEEGEVVKLSF